MAHTKAKGTTRLGRDSESKRLGVKIFGGSAIKCGQIIVRQRGTKIMPGENVKRGKDDTLYAIADGFVKFKKINHQRFNGNGKRKQVVSVEKTQTSNITPAKPTDKKNNIKETNQELANIGQEKIKAMAKRSSEQEPKSQIISQEKPVGKGIPTRREERK